MRDAHALPPREILGPRRRFDGAGSSEADRCSSELIATLVFLDPCMSRDPLEAQMSERRRKVPRVLDESLVRSNPPVPGESADRVLAIGMQNHVPTAVRDRRKNTHDRGQLCDVARRFADVLRDLSAVVPAYQHDSDTG